jgi:3-deoxy-7-phosphoheptulonate synthase
MASCAHLVDGTITETLHDESFRQEQLCDAAQALEMGLYEKVVEAVLLFEQNVAPLIAAASGEA